jgi:predicted secreted protein
MAQTDRIGHGTVLSRSSDATSSGTFTSVGNIRDVTPPGISRDAVEVTHMSSTEKWRAFIGGLKDGGELEFEMTFDPGSTETTAFHSDLNTDSAGYYKLVFPDSTEWGFSGLVTEIGPAAPLDDKMVADVTIKLTGKPGFIT